MKVTGLVCVALVGILSKPVYPQTQKEKVERDYVPVTQGMLNDPDPSDWLMWRRTYEGWGYSPLDQIDQNTDLINLINELINSN